MMRSLTLFIVVILFSATAVQAQNQGVKDRAGDAFREMNTGDLTLRFVNALDGEYVKGAAVTINGTSYTTDFEGKVLFKPGVTNGKLPVSFRKEGFISSEFNIDIMVGSIFQNQISVSPVMTANSWRIVLDWADRPRDLDAHLVKEGAYHISYRDKRTSDDGVARLDRDDTNGNGPETITINRIDDNEVYTFAVHNYSDRGNRRSNDLAMKSHATVRVFGDNQLIETFQLSRNENGVMWTVFQIKEGHLVPVSTID